MKNQIIFFITVFYLLQSACKRDKLQQNSFDFIPPEFVEAKGYVVPQVKTAPPEIIPAKEINSKAIGKAKVVNLSSNIYPVAKPKIVVAGEPKKSTPGQGGFALPKILPAIDSPFKAGIPEVTIAGSPQTKENNPASFSVFKVQQGLKTNMIFPIIQDRAGNLWIACFEGGVAKYDGRSFTNYTTSQGLCSDNIWSMLEDSKGNLWFGSFDGGGLNKFDGKYFTRYKIRQGLSDNSVISILEDRKGNLWFGTDSGGVNKYDGKTFTHFTTKQGLSGDHVRSIIEDRKGNLWFGTHTGVSKYDGNSFSNYTTDQGLSNTDVICLLEDIKGNFWIRSFGGSVIKYDGKVFEHYSIGQSLYGNVVDKILEDRSGNLWFTVRGEGVFKYDGKSFTQYSFEQGLSINRVHSILEDNIGNIWVGTDDGLCRYDGKTFTHFNSSLGFGEGSYNSICEDNDGNIWAGIYGSGVNRFDGKSVVHYTPDQGLNNSNVICLLKDSNSNLWVGTQDGGLNKYNGSSFSQFENFPQQTSVWSMLEDSKGITWFGTSKGLYKYDGKNFIHFGIAQGLSWESISSICEDRNGNLWLGTDYDGIVNKLDLSAAEEGQYSFTHYNINRGSSVSRVYSILEDKNHNLWFGINGEGVIKFDGKFFTRFTTAQGLSSNSVNSIVEDKDGNLWFLTNNGLCKMKSPEHNKGEKPNPDHRQISLFTTYLYADGFLGVGSHLNSMIVGRSGNVWAGVGNRLTCYHPEGDLPDTIPPNIQLSSVALFDEYINWDEAEKKKDSILILKNGTIIKNFKFTGLSSWYNQPENLQLAHNNNYITFQFIGITTNRPKQVRYKYFLEGLDENWSSITDDPTATYNNLPHGKFTFKAKAVNSEGYWSNELKYSFVILPPWWHTWWAYLAYISGFVTVVWLFSWYRSRWLKAENLILEEKMNKRTSELEQSLEERYRLSEKIESQQALLNERLRISRELHDDIGSTLGSISIYSEVAKNRTEKNENATEVLSKIGLTSRELIAKMSDIVWSLNPLNETFEQLQNRMQAFATMILVPRNILYDFIVTEELKKIQLTSRESKNIFLIYKEALYNMAKYADCKKASITLTLQKNNLIMIIQDDGKGFVVSETGANETVCAGNYVGGNGIKNMYARADDMNAKLCINTKTGEGTSVQLTVSL